MTDRPAMTSTHNQRAMTNEAGTRLHELLHWHTHGDLEFAIVMWPRKRVYGDSKVTTYTSTNDLPLGIKLASVVSLHGSGSDDDGR
jgi:hypothetical protein